MTQNWNKDSKNIGQWVYASVIILLIGGLIATIFIPNCNQSASVPDIQIEEGGFYSSFDFKVNLVNRYAEPSDIGDNVPSGYLHPISASEEVDYYYEESFESGSTDWMIDAGYGAIKSFDSYDGDNSYRIRTDANDRAVLYNENTYEILENETTDLIFYTKMMGAVGDDGYFTLSMNVSWTNPVDEGGAFNMKKITLVIDEGDTTGYTSVDPNEVVIRSSVIEYVWGGYLIDDIRNVTAELDDWVIGKTMTISDMHFDLESETTFAVYIDGIRLQKLPSSFKNLWYEGFLPLSDYQITIDYTIQIDTDAIPNIEDVEMRFDFYRAILTDSGEIPRALLESITLRNFEFNPSADPLYDMEVTNTFVGTLHGFPYWNFWGDTLTYTFDAHLEAYAPLIDGEYTNSALDADMTDEGFNVEWKDPINIQTP